MSLLANLAVGALVVTTAALAAVAVRGWLHTRSRKVAWLATAFGLLAAKGLFLSVLLFSDPAWRQTGMVPAVVLDVLAAAAFYQAVLRPSGT